jgi:hypothetical protein
MQPQTPTPNLAEVPDKGSIENLPQPIAPERGIEQVDQQAISGQEKTPTPGGDAANQNAGMPVVVSVPQPIDPQAVPTAVPMVQDDDVPQIAGDVDLIEKTWVRKAKQVVENTKDDPYNQNKQMNRVKAGYIKKRYNKEVKLAE